MLWYAEHGDSKERLVSDSASQDKKDYPSIRELLQSNSSLVVNGINCARGLAWEILARMIPTHPDRADDISALARRRTRDERSPAVRTMILYVLIQLFARDSRAFETCVRQLVDPQAGNRDEMASLKPLATQVGVRLFSAIERDVPGLALNLMSRMIKSRDPNLRLIGAWWTMAERLREGNSKRRFPWIHRRSPAHTVLWASILCEFAAVTEYRKMAIDQLRRLFFHRLPEVRREAASVFQHIAPDEFDDFVELAGTFIRSPAFRDSAFPLVDAFENLSSDVTQLVLEAGERIVLYGDARGSHSIFLIQQHLKREYANSELQPELRTRFLDLVDKMAMKNLPEADDLMRLHDR